MFFPRQKSRSNSRNNFGQNSAVRSGDDFDDRFDLFHFLLRLKLELPDQLREDGLLFHHGELLANAVPGAGRKWNVSVRVSGSSLNRKKIKFCFYFVLRHPEKVHFLLNKIFSSGLSFRTFDKKKKFL
jgi:hypothetical protein